MDITIAAYEELYRHGIDDAELSDQRRQLQNGGSDLEPLERASLLHVFREECAVWYKWHDDLCINARRSVYTALLDRYGPEAVVRWQSSIEAILDAAEAEMYAIVRDGCPLCVSHVLKDETVGRVYTTGPGQRVHSVIYGNGLRSSLRPCLSGHGAEEENNGT